MFQLIFYKIFPAENPFLFSHNGAPLLLQITEFSSQKPFIKFLIEHFKQLLIYCLKMRIFANNNFSRPQNKLIWKQKRAGIGSAIR